MQNGAEWGRGRGSDSRNSCASKRRLASTKHCSVALVRLLRNGQAADLQLGGDLFLEWVNVLTRGGTAILRENEAIEDAAYGRAHEDGQLIDVRRIGHVRPIGAKAESWRIRLGLQPPARVVRRPGQG